MTARRRILVFVDHNVVARHFLASHVFDELCAKADVTFVFPEAGGKRLTIEPLSLSLPGKVHRLPIDGRRQQLWRWLFFSEQLRLTGGGASRALRTLRRETLGWKASALLTLAGLPLVRGVFRTWVEGKLAERPATALSHFIAQQRPDALVHPCVLEGHFINDLIEIGRQQHIPVVAIMNSWDNPSTKRAVVGHPDWLLVWGGQTRQHALDYMHMPDERVVIFGAAQFDVFRSKPRIDRLEFCRKHAIDPGRPIVLYAGSSKQADEFAQLNHLDAAMESGRIERASIVYRPHPWGGGGMGGERFLSATWSNVRIESTMRGYLEGVAAGGTGESLPDYADTHDVLSAVDAVISPLSTILIEAVLHGKAAMCQLPEDEPGARHYQLARQLPCFRELMHSPAILLAPGLGGLIDGFPKLLVDARDPEARVARLEEISSFVETYERPWGTRFSEFLEDVVLGSAKLATAQGSG